MTQDRLYELISLRLAGEASKEELDELEQLLKAYPEQGLRMDLLDLVWDARPHKTLQAKKESFNRHMQRLSNHLSEPVLQYESVEENQEPLHKPEKAKSGGKIIKWVITTAVAASIAGLFFIFNQQETGSKAIKPTANNTVSTKRGSKSKVQLPDGTQVWLNADSRITYSENFQGSQREVELTGEAFFDVVRDETRPFIIHTHTIDLKVLGTSFNVRSYADEKNTETSLIHGSVEVTLLKSADKRKIVLKPNDKLIVHNQEALIRNGNTQVTHLPVMTLEKINYIKKDSAAVETLWVKNKLAFDEESIEDVALKIERWYDVKVVIADEKLKKEKLSATFEDESLSQVLEALQLAGIKSSMNRKEVILRQ